MNACQLLQNESMLALLPPWKQSECPYQMLCPEQCWCCCLGPGRFKYSVFKPKQVAALTDHFGHVRFLFFCWLSHRTAILPEQQIDSFRIFLYLKKKYIKKWEPQFLFAHWYEGTDKICPARINLEKNFCFTTLRLPEVLVNSRENCMSCSPAPPQLSRCESASCPCRVIPKREVQVHVFH